MFSLGRDARVNNYRPRHTQRVMKRENTPDSERLHEPRDAARTIKNRILRRRRDDAGANIICRRTDDSMQGSVRVHGQIGSRIELGSIPSPCMMLIWNHMRIEMRVGNNRSNNMSGCVRTGPAKLLNSMR